MSDVYSEWLIFSRDGVYPITEALPINNAQNKTHHQHQHCFQITSSESGLYSGTFIPGRQHGEATEEKEIIEIKPIHLNVMLATTACILGVSVLLLTVTGCVVDVDTSDQLQGPTPTELPAPSSEPVSQPGLGPSVMRNLQIARKCAEIFSLIVTLLTLCST